MREGWWVPTGLELDVGWPLAQVLEADGLGRGAGEGERLGKRRVDDEPPLAAGRHLTAKAGPFQLHAI